VQCVTPLCFPVWAQAGKSRHNVFFYMQRATSRLFASHSRKKPSDGFVLVHLCRHVRIYPLSSRSGARLVSVSCQMKGRLPSQVTAATEMCLYDVTLLSPSDATAPPGSIACS
jgi:hypothetical protein